MRKKKKKGIQATAGFAAPFASPTLLRETPNAFSGPEKTRIIDSAKRDAGSVAPQAEEVARLLETKNRSAAMALAVCREAVRILSGKINGDEAGEYLRMEEKTAFRAVEMNRKSDLDAAIAKAGEAFCITQGGEGFIQDMAKSFFRDPFVDAVSHENEELKGELKELRAELGRLRKENESLASQAKAAKDAKAAAEKAREESSRALNREILELEHRLVEMERRSRRLSDEEEE